MVKFYRLILLLSSYVEISLPSQSVVARYQLLVNFYIAEVAMFNFPTSGKDGKRPFAELQPVLNTL